MTTFQQLDKALHARGWTYDIGDEVFRDNAGKVIHNNAWLLALVPGITLDHRVSCMDDKCDEGTRNV